MDALLIVVTLVSLSFAVLVLVLNWRLIREERRRSAARVEALIEAALSPVPDAARDTAEPCVISSHELFHGRRSQSPGSAGWFSPPRSVSSSSV